MTVKIIEIVIKSDNAWDSKKGLKYFPDSGINTITDTNDTIQPINDKISLTKP